MIPYRTRNILNKLAVIGLVLLVVAAVVMLCWFLWLNRYVIYTRTGAQLDFSLSPELSQGQVAKPAEPSPEVDIYYNEGDNLILPDSVELEQLSGLCITGEMLQTQFSQVQQAVSGLSAETPVMLDVKNIRGEFYYSTQLGKNASSVDPAQMDALIAELKQGNRYLIARMPALRDYWFGLENVDCGVFNPNRLSLWMDDQRCYWLNPQSQGTLSHLIQIVTELQEKGFNEVVFTDFSLPDTTAIYFDGDRTQAINAAAETLAKACAKNGFALSFLKSTNGFVLPQGRTRLYLQNVSAAQAAGVVEESGIENAESRVVFLTDLMDTRFDDFSAMRPIKMTE